MFWSTSWIVLLITDSSSISLYIIRVICNLFVIVQGHIPHTRALPDIQGALPHFCKKFHRYYSIAFPILYVVYQVLSTLIFHHRFRAFFLLINRSTSYSFYIIRGICNLFDLMQGHIPHTRALPDIKGALPHFYKKVLTSYIICVPNLFAPDILS